MGLSQPSAIFGVHSITAYNITTQKPLGIAKVIGSCEITSEGTLIPLNGGSSKYPIKVERGAIKTQLSLKLSEYPDFLFETLLGKAITTNAAETGASVSAITAGEGTLVAATGIASIQVVKKGDVKFGKYLVIAASATTVDVYAYTDLDFAQGINTVFVNDLLKITATPLTITTGAVVTIPSYGISITGGAGTIGMTTGDTFTFTARPINTISKEVIIGASTEVFNDFGMLIAAQRQGTNEMFIIDCYKCSGSGLPIALTAQEFSEASTTIEMYYDATKNGVYRIETVKATT